MNESFGSESPSWGSALTNPQGSSHGGRLIVHSSKGNSVIETKELPMKAIAASKSFSDQLTDFEKGEILGY